jgi:xanthine/CO dehydrogenase XdhC/CoxF family maturation factor
MQRRRQRHIVIHRRTVPVGPPTPSPLRAVVFAIDSAKNSGTATYVNGKLIDYRELDARDPIARRQSVQHAITEAERRGLPLALVIEAPFGGRVQAALSLHATVTLWRDTWIALRRPLDHFIEQTAGTWRRELFGHKPLARPMARKLEALTALKFAERDMPEQRHYVIPPDAAAAICIGQVMIRSSSVREALGCTCVGRR